ncbi:hypothetical protein [Streptomyces shenzhenensis]|uniref:Uncharacterized protein n=1 Tax=Streptomyces shenzhenensis TaxID=943815 RepID=A0A3M0I1H3_9ACTN|nr:hypothetical protein [Streptomyces shenzhenensis]RMB82624.1 hypothetical protein CTZ28_28130 [Streptomyces shenzhenensis]
MISQEIRLRRYPSGRAGADDFVTVERAVRPPAQDEVRVRNLIMRDQMAWVGLTQVARMAPGLTVLVSAAWCAERSPAATPRPGHGLRGPGHAVTTFLDMMSGRTTGP